MKNYYNKCIKNLTLLSEKLAKAIEFEDQKSWQEVFVLENNLDEIISCDDKDIEAYNLYYNCLCIIMHNINKPLKLYIIELLKSQQWDKLECPLILACLFNNNRYRENRVTVEFNVTDYKDCITLLFEDQLFDEVEMLLRLSDDITMDMQNEIDYIDGLLLEDANKESDKCQQLLVIRAILREFDITPWHLLGLNSDEDTISVTDVTDVIGDRVRTNAEIAISK